MSAPAEAVDPRYQIKQVMVWSGQSSTWIDREVRAGRFPRPERFGQRRLWRLSVLETWAAAQAGRPRSTRRCGFARAKP